MFANNYTSATGVPGISRRVATTHKRMSLGAGVSEDGSDERDLGNMDIENQLSDTGHVGTRT